MPAWTDELDHQINEELRAARAARQAGLEGRSRVCARRAAGIALRVYYQQRGEDFPRANAYQLLQAASQDRHLPREITGICERLAMRVDEEYRLPDSVDLIDDAVRVIDWIKQSLEGVE